MGITRLWYQLCGYSNGFCKLEPKDKCPYTDRPNSCEHLTYLHPATKEDPYQFDMNRRHPEPEQKD